MPDALSRVPARDMPSHGDLAAAGAVPRHHDAANGGLGGARGVAHHVDHSVTHGN